MDSLKQWKTNSFLGFFPLESSIYLIFMVIFCSEVLQNSFLIHHAPFEGLTIFGKFIYIEPLIFLVAAIIGIYGLITAKKEFLIPVLIAIVITVIPMVASLLDVNVRLTLHPHANSYYIACILILPYAYFWYVIFSLYLRWS